MDHSVLEWKSTLKKVESILKRVIQTTIFLVYSTMIWEWIQLQIE